MTLNHFQACIDYQDIVSIQKIKGMNNKGITNQRGPDEIQKYLYDYYIQINLASINGFQLEKQDLEEELNELNNLNFDDDQFDDDLEQLVNNNTEQQQRKTVDSKVR